MKKKKIFRKFRVLKFYKVRTAEFALLLIPFAITSIIGLTYLSEAYGGKYEIDTNTLAIMLTVNFIAAFIYPFFFISVLNRIRSFYEKVLEENNIDVEKVKKRYNKI